MSKKKVQPMTNTRTNTLILNYSIPELNDVKFLLWEDDHFKKGRLTTVACCLVQPIHLVALYCCEKGKTNHYCVSQFQKLPN